MKRLRISVRLMLLLVALFATLFAWMAARRELRHANAGGEMKDIQLYREFTLDHPHIYTDEPSWRAALKEMDDLIEERRKILRESGP